MHCKSCLKPNDDDAVYCKFCGVRLMQREDQEEPGPGASWFDRAGRRKLMGRRLGAEGAAVLLVIGIVGIVGIGVSTAGAIYHSNASQRDRTIVDTGRKPKNSSHYTTEQSLPSPTPTIVAHGGYQSKAFPKQEHSSSSGVVSQGQSSGHPGIVLFERSVGKIGMCEIWILRWKTEGTSGVRLSREGDLNTEKFKANDHTVLRKAGHYKLEAVGSEGVETRTFDITGSQLCDK